VFYVSDRDISDILFEKQKRKKSFLRGDFAMNRSFARGHREIRGPMADEKIFPKRD